MPLDAETALFGRARVSGRSDPGLVGGRVASVVLAAGSGTRFGGCKQLAPLAGKPLIRHALEGAAALKTDETILVLGSRHEQIEAALDLGGVRVVHAADWQRGPQSSLAAALAALDDGVGAALVTLGDEPLVPVAAANRLLGSRRPGVPALRARYGARVGHPVLIECELFERMIALGQGETKPGRALRAAGALEIECGDLGEPADVDTPTQLARLAREAFPQED